MQTYSIRELSIMFELPASTLRYYEEIGLLTDVEHKNNQRIYNDSHISRLYAIECFKHTGLPIARMKDFFTYENNLTENIDNIIDLVSEHEQNVMKQIELLQKNLLHIQHKVRYYNGIKKAISSQSTWPKWEDFNE